MNARLREPDCMSRLVWAAFVIICVLSQATLHAATITVTGDKPRQSITVTIEDATLDFVLEHLRKHYGFEVAGLQKANQGEILSATMSGTLQSILERLLRNWNHMIVRSRDNESGIAKVMILNSVYGAAPSQVSPGKARRSRSNNIKRILRASSVGD
jgi:hypothetical protein